MNVSVHIILFNTTKKNTNNHLIRGFIGDFNIAIWHSKADVLTHRPQNLKSAVKFSFPRLGKSIMQFCNVLGCIVKRK